jgi:NitT/TauT family transport system permease protein
MPQTEYGDTAPSSPAQAPAADTAERATVAVAPGGRNRYSGVAPLPRGQRRALVVLGLVAVTLGWELVVRLAGLPVFIIPPPSSVLSALVAGLNWTQTGNWWPHLLATLWVTLVGLGIGIAVGLVTGVVLGLSRVASALATPYIVAFQAIPKVALAPIVLVWFGFGAQSKIVLAAMIAFFPVMVNTQLALLSPDRKLLELMDLIGASPGQVFRWVRAPDAVPMVMAGVELAALYSLLGTLVGEFVGSVRGLGVLLLQMADRLDTAGMFGVFVVLGAVGIVLHAAARGLGRRLVRWRTDA